MATGLVEGSLVSQVLTTLIDVIREAKDSKESLVVLQQRLQRLQPLLGTLKLDGHDLAQTANYDRWLRDLRQALRSALTLVSSSRGFVKRVLHKGDLDKINKRISILLEDAVGVLIQRQEELHRELGRQFKDAFELKSPQLKERSIKQLVGQRHTNHSNGRLSSGTFAPANFRWDRACEVPEAPRITFGGEAVVEEQIDEILRGEYRKWLVLWGMGGVGKTCTALRLYHHPSIQQHFTGGTYWVTVSKDQAPPEQILRLVYDEIQKKRPSSELPDDQRETFPVDLHAARAQVRNLLNREKVLLLLDDVWDSQTLVPLDVISEARKGVILITTRDRGILDFDVEDGGRLQKIAEHAKVMEIRPLSKADSWQLFCWHAFHVYTKSVLNGLRNVVNDVAEECKGLPLALKVIGSTMGATYLSDEQVRLGRTLEKEWSKALEQLRTASKGGIWRQVIERHRKQNRLLDDDASLYDRLQLSLDNLVEHPCLSACLYYFAAYPEDSDISVKDLLRMWAAEGLCRNEDEGVELLGVLIAKSVVELAYDGESCKIHDVMRDLLRLNLKYNAEREIPAWERMCLYEPGVNVSEFPNEWTSPNVFSARRLSLQVNYSLRELPDQFNAPDLVVLMLASTMVASLPRNFFAALSNLRVLDLSGTQIQKVSGSVLKNLKSLVLLDLRGCWMLRKISDELNSLEELQILLLRGTELDRLPQMKALTKLHTLSLTLPLRKDSETLANGVKIALFRNRFSEVLQARGLWQLRRLEIDGEHGLDFECGRDISLLSALEDLTTGHYASLGDGYASGLLELRYLRILRLDSIRRIDNLPALDKLPRLEEFTITFDFRRTNVAYVFPDSFGRRGGFPSLKKFKLQRVECWKMFMLQAGTMPKIEVLHFIDVGFEEWPVLAATLPTLKSLYLDIDFGARRDDNWSFLSQPNSFPNLECLFLTQSVNGELLPQGLPPYLLERREQGKLRVEIVKDSD